MGVDRIDTKGKFRITRKNVDAFMDTHYPDSDMDLHEYIQNLGWGVKKTRKDGILGVERYACGWIGRDEWEFFNSLAPYVEPGSYIEFAIYYDGVTYERWLFEDKQIKFQRGEETIEWKDAQPTY